MGPMSERFEKEGGETMRFSDGEKLLVFMMRDIYKHLKIEGEIDPDFICRMIDGGHYWAVKWALQGIVSDDHEDPPDVKFVRNVLNMWDCLEYTYEKLFAEEKERVAKEAEPFGKDVRFDGFDGNNETTYLAIARILVNDLRQASQFEGRDLNSHYPTIDMHQRMLEVFEPIRSTMRVGSLTADQLIQILKARRFRE